MEIVVQLVSSLVWPITVLIIVFLFRSELAKAFSRLSNLKYKELEIQFGNELEKIEQKVKRINLSGSAHIQSRTSAELTVNSKRDQLIKIAELSPRAAIMSTWFEVENALTKINNESLKQSAPSFRLSQIVSELVDKKIIDDSVSDIFRDLHQLRNQAVHHTEFHLSQKEAERYIDVALDLSRELLRAKNNLASINNK